ncbi:MAG: phosphoribosylformylglycinamidine synthase subunit PurQ [Elusimicrobiota bacterium]
MSKKRVKAIVLRTAGTNNDSETVIAFKKAGADVDLMHINRLFSKEADILNYTLLVIPGGFSYGDDISAGKVFANKLKYRLGKEMEKFISTGRIIIGICNGFQVLVKAGYLSANADSPITLINNDSGKFECRWVYLKTGSRKSEVGSFWTKNLPDIIQLPVAHAEGKFVVSDDAVLKKLEQNGQVVFKYTDESGQEAGYPYNPNGSVGNIAAICNTQGNVLGIMPHPERFITKYQHPAWQRERLQEEGIGLTIFKNAVEYVKNSI